MTWDEETDGPEPTQEQSDRLELFLRCGWPDVQAGPIAVTAAALGTEDEWAATAISYLKCMTSWVGEQRPTAALVSSAALSALLCYVERLETAAGIIIAPPEHSAGGAA